MRWLRKVSTVYRFNHHYHHSIIATASVSSPVVKGLKEDSRVLRFLPGVHEHVGGESNSPAGRQECLILRQECLILRQECLILRVRCVRIEPCSSLQPSDGQRGLSDLQGFSVPGKLGQYVGWKTNAHVILRTRIGQPWFPGERCGAIVVGARISLRRRAVPSGGEFAASEGEFPRACMSLLRSAVPSE
eukprot:9075501-Pyramimonas_sp.AAC.1